MSRGHLARGLLARWLLPRWLLRRFGVALFVSHAAGLLLLGLAALVEPDGLPLDVAWGVAGGTLSLLGGALGAGLLVRERAVVGLASLGARPALLLVAAALTAAVPGGASSLVPPPMTAPSGWVRADGGWIHVDGAVHPDVPDGTVTPRVRAAARPTRIVLHCVGAAAGAGIVVALASPVVPVLVLAATWLVLEAMLPPAL